jgi:anti-sigma-K factor RskA
VADHLADCAACRAELRVVEAVISELALTVPEVDPPAALKGRLMARVQPPRHATVSQPSPSWWQRWAGLTRRAAPVWSLVSLVLLLGLTLLNLQLWQQAQRPRMAVGPEGMRAIALDNTGQAPGAAGFMLIGTDGREGAVVVDKLPVLAETQEYQIWMIRDGEQISGALMTVDEVGYGGRRVTAPLPLADYAAIDITIEPAGGSPKPTGERILAAQIP